MTQYENLQGQDVGKDVFIDEHERPDVVEDRANFLKVMEDLKPYIVEFKEDDHEAHSRRSICG